MQKNVGQIDKFIRISFAFLMLILYVTNIVSGILGIVLLVFGAVVLGTAFFNFCFIYTLIGVNTCKLDK